MFAAFVQGPLVRVIQLGLVLLALQRTIFVEIQAGGVIIQIMMAMAAAAGVAGGSERGAIVGFTLGVMFDLAEGTPLGSTATAMTIAGAVGGPCFHALRIRHSSFSILSVLPAPVVLAASSYRTHTGTSAMGISSRAQPVSSSQSKPNPSHRISGISRSATSPVMPFNPACVSRVEIGNSRRASLPKTRL